MSKRKHKFLNQDIIRGRYLKAPEGEGDGGGSTPPTESGQPGSNAGGNSGESTPQTNGAGNNDGQQFNPDQFWKLPESGEDGQGTQQESNPADIGKEIATEIAGFKLQTPVFDDSIAKEIADGNLDGVNQRLAQMSQSVMRQAVVFTARIMKAFEESMESRMQGMIQTNQSASNDETLLKQSFGGFNQPAMQPVIRGVFQQSLTHTKGDRQKAIEMTKGMLKQMGQIGQADFGITTAPRNPDDVYGADSSKSLVRDLLEFNG